MKKSTKKKTSKATEKLDLMVRGLETQVDAVAPNGAWTCRRMYCI